MSLRAHFHTLTRPALAAPGAVSTQSPGIAVVMAMHNTAPWLPRCLSSIAAALQGFRWALIVADDASTDGSAEIVERWAASRPGAAEILLSRHPKAVTVGVAKNRAFAIARQHIARYPISAPMDADDEMLPDRVRGLLPALKNGVRAVVSDWERERDGRCVLHHSETFEPHFGPWATLFETSLIPADGELFRPDMEAHSDLLLWDEWNRRGINWRAVKGVVTHVHHCRTGSVSNPGDAALAARRRARLETARRELDTAFSAKISYCTTCMGRLHHLKETLPASIAAHPGAEVEFCLIDYNSVDANCPHRLYDWVMMEMREHVDSGKLKFKRTIRPHYFRPAHAKNLAHRLATGEILVNLDADNTATAAFTEHVRGVFARGLDSVLHIFDHDPSGRHTFVGGGAGRIAISRENFYLLGGYDEALVDGGWGGEDTDLCRRAVAFGLRDCALDQSLVKYIPHDDAERTARMRLQDKTASNAAAMRLSRENIAAGRLEANTGKEWGMP